MSGGQRSISEVIVVGAAGMLILAVPVGAVWLVSLWAEDRFGETGSIVMAVLGILVVIVLLVLAIGLLFAKVYRAGAVDTIRGQQITQQGNTQAVKDITGALRGELNQSARTQGAYERDVLQMANKKAAILVSENKQLTGTVEPAASVDVDAEWYELRRSHGITYDE